ncbi:MAG: hypothetical protein RSA66_08920, partial [Muribaculaceae bacterium]
YFHHFLFYESTFFRERQFLRRRRCTPPPYQPIRILCILWENHHPREAENVNSKLTTQNNFSVNN